MTRDSVHTQECEYNYAIIKRVVKEGLRLTKQRQMEARVQLTRGIILSQCSFKKY